MIKLKNIFVFINSRNVKIWFIKVNGILSLIIKKNRLNDFKNIINVCFICNKYVYKIWIYKKVKLIYMNVKWKLI